MVAFQKKWCGRILSNPSKFIHIDITNISLSLNGDFWPNERMILDLSKNEFSEAYKRYVDFYSSYGDAKHLLLNYTFKTHSHRLFRVGAKHEMNDGWCKINDWGDASIASQNTYYVHMFYDTIVEFHPLTEIVRNIL